VEVQVRLFANLADYLPPGARGGTARVHVPEGATLADLLGRLRVPSDIPRLLFVNGRDAAPGDRLQAGDVVSVLPPLSGGALPPPGPVSNRPIRFVRARSPG
jgi:molybdopterin converting factor small subunit